MIEGGERFKPVIGAAGFENMAWKTEEMEYAHPRVPPSEFRGWITSIYRRDGRDDPGGIVKNTGLAEHRVQ